MPVVHYQAPNNVINAGTSDVTVKEITDNGVAICVITGEATVHTEALGDLQIRIELVFGVELFEGNLPNPVILPDHVTIQVLNPGAATLQTLANALSASIRGIGVQGNALIVGGQVWRPWPQEDGGGTGLQGTFEITTGLEVSVGIPLEGGGFEAGSANIAESVNGSVVIRVPPEVVEQIAGNHLDWTPGDEAPAQPLPGPPVHDEVEPIVLPGDPDEETIIEDLWGDSNP